MNAISPGFTSTFLDELRERTPLRSLVGRRVELKKAGRGWKGCCPFHNERSPSFYVYDSRYHCYGCGADGDAIEFAKQTQGLTFVDAVAQLAGEAGLELPDVEPTDPAKALAAKARAAAQRAEAERRREQREAEAATDEARRVRRAQSLASEAVPIAGTAAELYLNHARRIPTPIAGWADDIRYHRRHNAVVAVATWPDATVRAVQRVFLDDEAEKLSDEAVAARGLDSAKVTNGAMDGAVVRLPGDVAGPLLIGEGPETCLSAWSVTGIETWIALGAVSNLKPGMLPTERRVVILGEDMPRHHPVARNLRKALTRWRRAGRDVVVAMPWATDRGDKSDMNDALCAGGPVAVVARINLALHGGARVARARVPVAKARPLLDKATARFSDIARTWKAPVLDGFTPSPPVHALRTSVGSGKTRANLRAVSKMLAAMRDSGDERTVAIAVPTHGLGDQQATDFAALPEVREAVRAAKGLGLTAAVWRGRYAPDPKHADFKEACIPKADKTAMCVRLDAVEDAIAAGARSIQAACCKSKKGCCDAFNDCSYQAMLSTVADAWVVPHELIYMQKPDEVGELAALITDEASWQDGLAGCGEAPVRLSLDSLDASDLPPGLSWQELAHYRGIAHHTLRDLADGAVPKYRMLMAGLTEASARIAGALEWRRYDDPKMWPGMPAEERKAVRRAVAGNKTVRRLVAFWKAMEHLLTADGPLASGEVAIATEMTDDGPVRVLRMKHRKDIAKGWRVPTLVMDANLDLELVRPFWPQAELVADIELETPFQRIRQVGDCAFAKSRFIAPAGAAREEVDRCRRNLRDLHAILYREAMGAAPGRTLIVAQLDVEEALKAFAPLPAGVEFAHHNGIAGRNDWADVRLLVVIGRTIPPPFDMRLHAEALSGRAIKHDDGWYQRTDAVREMADGSSLSTKADRHPDALCEALRWQACEGELVQIIGRGRGADRTAANPLDVLVLTDVPLPLPVDEVISVADLTPSAMDLMLADAGVALENAKHAAIAFPSLWPSHDAAAKALSRRSRTFPYKISSNREMSDSSAPGSYLAHVAYQVAGKGSKAAVAWCDRERVSDPGAFLAAALRDLGELAWWRWVEGTTEPPDSPAPPPPEPPRPPLADPPPEPQPRPPPRVPDPTSPAPAMSASPAAPTPPPAGADARLWAAVPGTVGGPVPWAPSAPARRGSGAPSVEATWGAARDG